MYEHGEVGLLAKRRSARDNRRNGRRGSPPPRSGGSGLGMVMFVLAAVAIVALTAYVLYATSGGGDGGNPPPVGDDSPAPQFALTDIDGNPVSTQSLRGKVVVLDLFATWCGPCKSQMAELRDVRSHYSSTDVVILSIDVDPSETTAQVREFKSDYGATWAFARDTNSVGTKYGADAIPTLAIIDRDGNLTYRNQGLEDAGSLIARIDPLLAA
jgi:thiol-disulfide isomerase/thioredoxin